MACVKWILWMVLAASLGASPQSARAQGEAASNDTVISISKQLMCPCPTCGGKALDQCHKGCADGEKHRTELAGLLRQNKNREEILQFFSSTYGASMLGAPPSEGFGSFAVWTPLAALLLGAIPVVLFTRRSQKRKSNDARPRNNAQPGNQDDRVAAELRDFDY